MMKIVLSVLFFISTGGFVAGSSEDCSCQLIPGPPGRDGRDGTPGPPGSISYSEFTNLKREILEEIRNDLCQNQLSCSVQPSGVTPPGPAPSPTSQPKLPGTSEDDPATCCDDIYQADPNAPSGYYWINTTTQGVIKVYCGISPSHCDTGAWTRVALLNMSDPLALCPDTFTEREVDGHRLCVKSSQPCDSVIYSTFNKPYTRVCGRAVGFQFGNRGPCAFSTNTLEQKYLSGISITHGAPGSRSHIWSFAVGWADTYYHSCNCPCAKQAGLAPGSFVGNSYYCESPTQYPPRGQWYTNQTLWDGQDCYTGSNCCNKPNAPWFVKQLRSSTQNDLEVRWCGAGGHRADSPLGTILVEMYVQ